MVGLVSSSVLQVVMGRKEERKSVTQGRTGSRGGGGGRGWGSSGAERMMGSALWMSCSCEGGGAMVEVVAAVAAGTQPCSVS